MQEANENKTGQIPFVLVGSQLSICGNCWREHIFKSENELKRKKSVLKTLPHSSYF